MNTYTKQVRYASASSPYKILDLIWIFIEQISHRKSWITCNVYEIMTPIIAKLKKINYWIAGAATMMVIFGALYPFAQGKSHISGFGDTANIHDDFFIQGVRNVTKSIPKNETLVVTGYTTVIQYFTNHPVKLPWKGKVKSEKTLVTWCQTWAISIC